MTTQQTLLKSDVELLLQPDEWLRVELNSEDELNLIPFVMGPEGKPIQKELGWYANYGWAQQIIGKSRIQNYWNCPLNDAAALALDEWPAERIQWQGDRVKLAVQARKLSLRVREKVAELIANYKKYNVIPAAADAIKSRPGITLNPFQKLGAYVIKNAPNWGIWFEQGCGKTPTLITGACECARDRADKTKPYKVLGIVPPNLLLNWCREIPRFSTCRGVVADLVGTVPKRTIDMLEAMNLGHRLQVDYVWCLISSDSVSGFVNALKYITWDFIYVDESHGIKDPKAKRTQAVTEEIGYGNPQARKYTLTGTPVNNSLGDLYQQLEFMEKGRSGFSSHTQFKESFSSTFKTRKGIILEGKQSNIDKRLQEMIAKTAFIVKKKDVLKDLPEKMFSVRGIEMTAQQMSAYKMLRDQLILEANEELGMNGGSLMVNHILTKLLRLTQITAGFVSWDPETDEDGNPIGERVLEHFSPNNKIAEMLNVVSDMEDTEKAIIWCTLEPTYDRVKDALELAGHKVVEYTGRVTSRSARQAAEDAFNLDPSVRFMVANPKSAGTGLNLLGYDKLNPSSSVTNCTKHINFSLNWSWAQRAQAMDRSHRQGTRAPLEIIDLIATNTIDQIMLEALEAKAAMAEELASIDVRKILDSLKKVT